MARLTLEELVADGRIHPTRIEEVHERSCLEAPANMVMLSPVPLATAAAIGALWLSLERRMRYAPFLLAAVIFLLCYTGLAVSLFPYIIPPTITLWQAAAAPESQLFMLYGAIPILPIILGYTAYSYYVFWDATEHEGYH
jgi:cytochrome d ubiquinol oxidase subunit II